MNFYVQLAFCFIHFTDLHKLRMNRSLSAYQNETKCCKTEKSMNFPDFHKIHHFGLKIFNNRCNKPINASKTALRSNLIILKLK